jgi:proteasome lid subunit RPN8/RPN11
MPNNYEQEICNILKEIAIHQKLEELRERTKATGQEHGFNVCSDGRVTEIVEGSEKRLNIAKINKECNNKIDIGIHSHPRGNPYPSAMDFSVELNSQPMIASCIYGTRTDSVTCYRTSDELRNKYVPLLEESLNKIKEIVNKHNNTNNPEERLRLSKAYKTERNRFTYLTNITKYTIIKDIYPDITSIRDYTINASQNPKVGNFGDVWVKDCGKM